MEEQKDSTLKQGVDMVDGSTSSAGGEEVQNTQPENMQASRQPAGEDVQAGLEGAEQMKPRQPEQPGQNMQQIPPGYAIDPQTGQLVYIGQFQQPQQPYTQPHVVYVQPQPSPEQIAAEQAAAQQRYGMIVNSVEQFLEGEASVSDVVKTLYTTTSQDDQLWKGVVVGAAAAILLTSDPVKEVMGKTLGGLFPGLKEGKKASSENSTEKAEDISQSTITEKE